jgi:Cytochrome P450
MMLPQTVVEAWFAALYRDHEHFVDPDSFLPERWLDDDDKDERFARDRRDVFMPFGTGPRACPGKVYVFLWAPPLWDCVFLHLSTIFTFSSWGVHNMTRVTEHYATVLPIVLVASL